MEEESWEHSGKQVENKPFSSHFLTYHLVLTNLKVTFITRVFTKAPGIFAFVTIINFPKITQLSRLQLHEQVTRIQQKKKKKNPSSPHCGSHYIVTPGGTHALNFRYFLPFTWGLKPPYIPEFCH